VKDEALQVKSKKTINLKRIPKHRNVINHFLNIELFHEKDTNQEDCLGWITIMEKAEKDLRTVLKNEMVEIQERKEIAEGIRNGISYLMSIGIKHFDQKLENVLLLDRVPKIIDFGLVREESGISGYREMGYARRGSKFRVASALCKFI
jgi:serine/threonine protein kinase